MVRVGPAFLAVAKGCRDRLGVVFAGTVFYASAASFPAWQPLMLRSGIGVLRPMDCFLPPARKLSERAINERRAINGHGLIVCGHFLLSSVE